MSKEPEYKLQLKPYTALYEKAAAQAVSSLEQSAVQIGCSPGGLMPLLPTHTPAQSITS